MNVSDSKVLLPCEEDIDAELGLLIGLGIRVRTVK